MKDLKTVIEEMENWSAVRKNINLDTTVMDDAIHHLKRLEKIVGPTGKAFPGPSNRLDGA